MDRLKVIMAVTAVMSIISFNFNKLVDWLLLKISTNIHDESVITYGPYYKSKPVDIKLVMIDTVPYTNKFKLLMNWKWNFDMHGFLASDVFLVAPKAKIVIMQYKKKHGVTHKLHTRRINLVANTMTEKSKTSDILFEEICLC